MEKGLHEKIMFAVQRSDASTLIPIIKRNAVFGNDNGCER